jgi:organic hydroperoxide reductase OsmC/OhrA
MSEHHATVDWQRKGAEFAYETYPRSHELRFAHASVPGTAAPGNRPSTAEGAPGVDPEEAFVGALSSCHMLWFLHLACQKKWVVDRYLDEAVGVLDKTWVSRVTLRPVVSFSGAAPSPEEHQALHEKAHQRCFIANSVKTDVLVEPRIA